MKKLLAIVLFCVFLVPCTYGETITYSDGSKYVGEVFNGLLHGQGTLTFPSGEKYVGEWKDGKKHGQGTFTYPDGRKYVGEWKDNNQWSGTMYNADGSIEGKYKEGKWSP
jgi:hypothetical protein